MKNLFLLFMLLCACTLLANAQNKENSSVGDTTGLQYIADNGVEVTAYNRSVTTNKKGVKIAGNTTVVLKTKLINKGNDKVKLKVFHQFLNQDEKFVGETDWAFCTILPGDSSIVEQTANLSNIHMWTEGDPFKHVIVTKVQKANVKIKEDKNLVARGMVGVGQALFGLAGGLVANKIYENTRRDGDKYLTPILFGRKE